MIEKIKECSIENAISQSNKVIGFTSRQRNIQPPRVCFDKMIVDIINLIVASSKFEVSFVFGGEKSGLSNNDIKKCTNVCSLDVDCSYPSLNLSHAIQVVSYMFRRQLKIKYDYLNKQNYFLPESNLLETQNKTKLTNQKRVINIEKKILSLSDKVNFRTPTKQGEIAARIHKILVSNEISDKDAKLLESFFALIEKKLNL